MIGNPIEKRISELETGGEMAKKSLGKTLPILAATSPVFIRYLRAEEWIYVRSLLQAILRMV